MTRVCAYVAVAAMCWTSFGASRADDPFSPPSELDHAPAEHQAKVDATSKIAGLQSARIEFLPLLSPNEAKIYQVLNEKTKFDFAETALSDVVDYIKQKHEIEVQLDNKGLADAAVDPSAPITKSVDGITLRSALRLILEDLDLTYVVQDEVLKITSKARTNTILVTRVYPVADLVLAESDRPDYESLVRAITGAVDPSSWDKSDGSGTVTLIKGSKSLVIFQTRAVHDKVLELLRSLRMSRDLAQEQAGAEPGEAPAGRAVVGGGGQPAANQPGGGTVAQPNIAAPGGGLRGGLLGGRGPGPGGGGLMGVQRGGGGLVTPAAPQESVPAHAGVEQIGRFQVTTTMSNNRPMVVVIDTLNAHCWSKMEREWHDWGIPPWASGDVRGGGGLIREVVTVKDQLGAVMDKLGRIENQSAEVQQLKEQYAIEIFDLKKWLDVLEKKAAPRAHSLRVERVIGLLGYRSAKLPA